MGWVDPLPVTTRAAGMDSPAALTLSGLRVRRGRAVILNDLSLDVPAGAITALVGRSGVGKSTLIATLNGLLRPEAGTIAVAGIGRLDGPAALRAHRRQTATIFQDHALIDRLTALDNVLLGLADQRHPLSPLPWPGAFRRRAAEALAKVGLLERAHARVATLSGGERQRVGVARALIRRPRLLLGDEPFAAVDPALVRQLCAEFRVLVHREALTVLVVLHQIDTARRLADRMIALGPDGLAFVGPSDAFTPEIEARVFTAPPSSPSERKD